MTVVAALAVLTVAGLAGPAAANCIAHQPANAQFNPPAGLQINWDCVTGGPLYDHEREWFIVTFKATNTDARRIAAMKLQANFVDAFGDVLRTVPIVENARLSTGDSDAAVWAFRPTVDKNSLDHVAFYVIAVKYEDGSLWNAPGSEPKAGPTPAPLSDDRDELRYGQRDRAAAEPNSVSQPYVLALAGETRGTARF
jgi:hypothetical protein